MRALISSSETSPHHRHDCAGQGGMQRTQRRRPSRCQSQDEVKTSPSASLASSEMSNRAPWWQLRKGLCFKRRNNKGCLVDISQEHSRVSSIYFLSLYVISTCKSKVLFVCERTCVCVCVLLTPCVLITPWVLFLRHSGTVCLGEMVSLLLAQ